jgi:hypothetical protein
LGDFVTKTSDPQSDLKQEVGTRDHFSVGQDIVFIGFAAWLDSIS